MLSIELNDYNWLKTKNCSAVEKLKKRHHSQQMKSYKSVVESRVIVIVAKRNEHYIAKNRAHNTKNIKASQSNTRSKPRYTNKSTQ